VSYTISAAVENLTLTGILSINGTGNALDNVITGNAAANTLDGSTGEDSLIGGAGNDVYIVDDTNDDIIENAGEGTDTIRSSVSYTVSANVENLTLTGGLDINATGNGSNNTLTGNTGNNTLDGGVGADLMQGGTGNDVYIVDNAGDVAAEGVGAGTDVVRSSVSYTLGANVEQLELGGGAINGFGNALDNIIIGGAGSNTLSGGVGADTITGGAGADTLTGGAGADVFKLQLASDSGDVITDFSSAQGDVINLATLLSGNGAGDTFLASAAFTGGANNEVRVVSVGGTQFTVEVELAGDGNAVADYTMTVFSVGAVTPAAADFVLA